MIIDRKDYLNFTNVLHRVSKKILNCKPTREVTYDGPSTVVDYSLNDKLFLIVYLEGEGKSFDDLLYENQ